LGNPERPLWKEVGMILSKSKCASIVFAIAIAVGLEAGSVTALSQADSTTTANGVFALLNGPWMGPGVQTFPASIDDQGDIVGSYLDASWMPHGFVQMRPCRQGNFEDEQVGCGQTFLFDATGEAQGQYGGTWLNGMDAFGTVLGRYTDGDGLVHGGLWRRSCEHGQCTFNFQSFDAPGAGQVSYFPGNVGTFPSAISATGVVVGTYYDADENPHPFVATPRPEWPFSEDSVKLDFSGIASTGDTTGYGIAISGDGIATGEGCGPSSCQVWVRSLWGAVTTFDPQPAGGIIQPASVNSFGAIVGSVYDQPNGSFLRLPNGTQTTLDFGPTSISDRGEIMGSGGLGIVLRQADGTETTIGPTAPWLEIRGVALNDRGWVTGWVEDTTYLPTGFIWKPAK
jgi:hypothetical protein